MSEQVLAANEMDKLLTALNRHITEQKEMDPSDLLNCPFCGFPAQGVTLLGAEGHKIECANYETDNNCSINPSTDWHLKEEDALAQWNARPFEKSLLCLLEQVAKVLNNQKQAFLGDQNDLDGVTAIHGAPNKLSSSLESTQNLSSLSLENTAGAEHGRA